VSQDSQSPKVPRRQLLSAAGAGWIALGGSAITASWTAARFMRPNASDEPGPEIDAGPASQYLSLPGGQVSESARAAGVWLVRLPDRIIALDATCTHLGCRVAWFGDDRRFRCPCHGSSFAIDGVNLDGPAPRELYRLAVCIREGRLIVDRSRRFQKHNGGWDNPDSFVAA